MASPTHIPETSLPERETAAAVCPHCGQPFVTERQCALHVGERHEPTEIEKLAYEDAREDESDELFRLHLKVVFAVGLLYAAGVVAGIVAFSLPG